MQIRRMLFLGLGGAGQRQLRIFRSLLPEGVEYSTFRACSKTPLLAPDFTPIAAVSTESYHGLRRFDSLDTALDSRPDVVVIATPTALHIPTAIEAAKRGIHIFMEKPLGSDLTGVAELEGLCREMNTSCYVAFQRRFHPCFQRASKLVREGALGKIVAASFTVTSFVPHWHQYEDFRELYAVRSELGGGVLLTECHEFDQCAQIFGLPDRVHAVGGALADESLDVEDTVSVILEYREDSRRIPVQLFLSFMQPHVQRSWWISGTMGHLAWHEQDNTLRHHDYGSGSTSLFKPEGFGPETTFTLQAKHYLQWLSNGPETEVEFINGKASLLIALAAKRSLRSGQSEPVQV